MPFQPLRLLILYDDAAGFCERVVPRMRLLLQQRAFLVDLHPVKTGSVDVAPYAGVVIGTPVFGFGVRGAGPSEALLRAVRALGSLDERKVAVFCAHLVRPGRTLDRMRGMVLDLGAEVVASHAYSLLHPRKGDHMLPTECMVRIR